MLEAIVFDKFLFIAKHFNFVSISISIMMFTWIFFRGIRDAYCYTGIDYYNIYCRENKFVFCTVIICILQTLVLFNPLTISMPGSMQNIYEAFKDQYMYLILFSINYTPLRVVSISILVGLFLLYKSILSSSNNDVKYANRITRSLFINTSVIIILALIIQVVLYLLIPSNDFIIHNIVGIDSL